MNDFKKFCIDEKLSPVQIVGARKAWQEQQAIIDNLKAQLNNMEACYIEKKKEVEDALHILDELYRKGLFAKPKAVSEAINVLRGES